MSDIQLDRRGQHILAAVVEEFVASGEPVGSRTLSKTDPEGLSPASIRNTMADLESMGLLEQPHTSAGRVPTDLGYRLYVDDLMRRGSVGEQERTFIEQSLGRPVGEVGDLFQQVSRVLSKVSHQIGVIVAPSVAHVRLRHIEFVRLAPRRVVAILVADTGFIHNKVFETEEDHTQEQLDASGRYLTEAYQGCTLPETRQKIAARLAEEQALYDRLMRSALNLGRKSVEDADGGLDVHQVYLDGASNLLGAPEFADVERLRGILRTLEERHHLLGLLGRCLEEGRPGVKVLIGAETLVPDLQQCTVVTSTYGPEGEPRGALGVIGPTRMEYAKAIALVDYVSRLFGRMLERYGA